jgi:hypothetical protein
MSQSVQTFSGLFGTCANSDGNKRRRSITSPVPGNNNLDKWLRTLTTTLDTQDGAVAKGIDCATSGRRLGRQVADNLLKQGAGELIAGSRKLPPE